MKNQVGLFVIGILLASHSANATQAQPVPVPEDQALTPQISISGVGAATLDTKKSSGINFSDSALVIGAAQRLADGKAIGSTGLGWLTLDDTNKGLGTQLFLNQAFLDYQGERFEALVGRSDNPTAHLVDFPTIRGDDLVTLTNPMNPYSNGENAEEHRYSNVASVTINQGFKYYQNFHAQHLIDSFGDSAGIRNDTRINAFGATFYYLGTPGLEAFERFPSWGVGIEHFTINPAGSGGLHQVSAGGVMNLNESVVSRWDLRLQDIVGFGSDLAAFSNTTDSYQADANTLTASVRFLSSPFGGPGYQIALTGARKDYFDVSGAKSYGAALTGVKRLGQGFDLVAQYQGQWRDKKLAAVQTPGNRYEQNLEVGFVFSFEATINQHLAPRRSILNQQHQYVPN